MQALPLSAARGSLRSPGPHQTRRWLMDIETRRQQAINEFLSGLRSTSGHRYRTPGGRHDALVTKLFDQLGDLEIEEEVTRRSTQSNDAVGAQLARDAAGRYAPQPAHSPTRPQ